MLWDLLLITIFECSLAYNELAREQDTLKILRAKSQQKSCMEVATTLWYS